MAGLSKGTPHIKADKGAFAKTVLLPGDPLRAKWIAETFLEDVVQVNEVRNMFGYTGTYKGKKVSVMGSGMGVASAGIYSFELFDYFDVDNVIRIGTAGAYNPDLEVGTVVMANKAFSESPFAEMSGIKTEEGNILSANNDLVNQVKENADKLGIKVQEGTIHSSDVFYNIYGPDHYQKMGIDAVEMEAFALYTNAIRLNKKALCICTISDNIVTGKMMSAEDRQNKLVDMVTLGLETAINQ